MNQRAMRWMTMRLAIGIAATLAVMMGTGLTVTGQTPADVAGDWALTVETDQGTTTPSVMLEQNGSELTGHYSSETLGEAEVKGSVSGNDVVFSLSASAGGFDIEVTYAGTLQDDGTLSGQIDLGGLGGGTFTGRRR